MINTVKLEPSVTLSNILRLLSSYKVHHWSLIFLEAMGDLKSDRSMAQLQDDVSESTDGYHLSWEELLSLSESFDQVIEMTLLGCNSQDRLTRYSDESEMRSSCDFTIEMVDSSYWEVSSKNIDFLENLSNLSRSIKL